MRPIVIEDIVWYVCLCAGHDRKPCKTADPIELAVAGETRVGPGNHVCDEVQIPHEKGHFGGYVPNH